MLQVNIAVLSVFVNVSELFIDYAMKTLSKETRLLAAIQLVLMDSIEKGYTNADELIEYMKTERFQKAVESYVELMQINLF